VVQVLNEIHQVVVDLLIIGVDDSIQIREVPVKIDIVGIGPASQEVLATLEK